MAYGYGQRPRRKEFRNTFKRGGGFDGPPLKSLPAGKHVVGLISVKNVVKEDQWGQHDAIRMFFLAKDGQSCVCHDCNATIAPNSNLTKTLINMTDCNYDADTAGEAETFELVNGLVDRWYEVQVKTRQWTPDESKPAEIVTFSRVNACNIFPISLKDGPDLPPKAWMARLRENWKAGNQQPVEAETIPAPETPAAVEEEPPAWLEEPEKEGSDIPY